MVEHGFGADAKNARLKPGIVRLHAMARVPHQVSALLDELAAQLPVLLGKNVIGVYVCGSLTQQAFDPRRSDVDCIAVLRRA